MNVSFKNTNQHCTAVRVQSDHFKFFFLSPLCLLFNNFTASKTRLVLMEWLPALRQRTNSPQSARESNLHESRLCSREVCQLYMRLLSGRLFVKQFIGTWYVCVRRSQRLNAFRTFNTFLSEKVGRPYVIIRLILRLGKTTILNLRKRESKGEHE